MKSKTSCFNKTIFLKNMTRFWPVQYDRANVPEHPQLYEYPGS